MVSSPDPYNGGRRYHYDKGTYRAAGAYASDPGAGVYRGDFLYFQDNTGSPWLTKRL